jgi:hypothetical protein
MRFDVIISTAIQSDTHTVFLRELPRFAYWSKKRRGTHVVPARNNTNLYYMRPGIPAMDESCLLLYI